MPDQCFCDQGDYAEGEQCDYCDHLDHERFLEDTHE